ncbi:hypothetical protein Sango_3036500 [Sesamum angolense]|uniref:Integrase catalytic domain-containing protein n=1 Tax=Sesamum angolense TaxID=2727404 RepID=A0AAE1TCK6_9LAMI|nr:hypothetical protein Sango_3036500 [Sesamum angolense]
MKATWGKGLSREGCEVGFILTNNAPRCPREGKMFLCISRTRKHKSSTIVVVQPLKSPCPFDQWGMNLVGPFLQATGQRKFLIVAVKYFTKLIEAEPLAKIIEKEVIKFLWKNIVCRFDIPRALVSDNGTQFSRKKLKEWRDGLTVK